MDGRIAGLGIFLDGVAALGLDDDFAFRFLLSDLAAGCGAIPVPGDYSKVGNEVSEY